MRKESTAKEELAVYLHQTFQKWFPVAKWFLARLKRAIKENKLKPEYAALVIIILQAAKIQF